MSFLFCLIEKFHINKTKHYSELTSTLLILRYFIKLNKENKNRANLTTQILIDNPNNKYELFPSVKTMRIIEQIIPIDK